MHLQKIVFILFFGLSTQCAWASSDDYCEPTWAINQGGYSRCSNAPILAPSNDTRVNLILLLIDEGFAKLEAKPIKEDAAFGYGKVPFSLETFENDIVPINGRAKSENETAGSGGATRCISDDSGTRDFIEAVNQSKELSLSEREMLTKERLKLSPDCINIPDPKKTANTLNFSGLKAKVTSSTCKQFMHYLVAANAFYVGNYDEAGPTFAKLCNSSNPWLKEASSYMLGRTELNLAQHNAFDTYGFPTLDNVDKKALLRAEEKFKNYLKVYPGGRYAPSARGLLRRVYWLGNQQEKLAAEYEWQLTHPNSPLNNSSLSELAWEADQKLLFNADLKQIKNPLLLATMDLSLMRPSDSSTQRISFSDLHKQQPFFAGHKALYDYLLAAHLFYVQKDAPNCLKALSDTIPPTMTNLDFSRLTLRGIALEATQDHAAARKVWQTLVPVSRQALQNETLQLALALNYEHSNAPELAFQPGSPITEPEIRTILLRNDASPKLLRQVIASRSTSGRERTTALYTLLYKDLLQGHYQDYIKDYRLLPKAVANHTRSSKTDNDKQSDFALFTWSGQKSDDGYGCPSTLEIAKILAKNAKDPYGLICLGDFVNSNDLASGYVSRSHSSPKLADISTAVLGSAPSHFQGEQFSRGESYKMIIADAKAAPDLKAYALYRSIKCYSPSGYNHCGGDNVEKSVRKSWFQALKKQYSKTDWAKSLKYYW